jgi:hypothetical protein
MSRGDELPMNDATSARAPVPQRPERTSIFISYRRREAAGYAGWLHARLVEYFGAGQVFMDIEIRPGFDWEDQIRDAVGSCDALIAIIGPDWAAMADKEGRRRIDDPSDVHRLELEAALAREVQVIPALVQDAEIPDKEDLPEPLRRLVRRQALELSDTRWDHDVDALIRELERALAEAADAASGGPRWRRRAGRLGRRARRLVIRHRSLSGLLAGALCSLLGVGAFLAATGRLDRPFLEVTSFDYLPPTVDSSIARKCVVRAESEYVITTADFIVDGDPRNSLEEQIRAPWECNNSGNANQWDTCEGHSREFTLDPNLPHKLTVTLTDFHGNTVSKTRSVETNCPRGAG